MSDQYKMAVVTWPDITLLTESCAREIGFNLRHHKTNNAKMVNYILCLIRAYSVCSKKMALELAGCFDRLNSVFLGGINLCFCRGL